MSDCCTTSESKATHPRKRLCPGNGGEGMEVQARTIAHHIRHAWQWNDNGSRYYFCADPECDIVYFGDDGSVILKSQLRTLVGVKEACGEALACYCFGVTKADALSDFGIRNFVVLQTKLGLCSCDTSNPSGRCCLKNFPRGSDSTLP